MSSRASVYPDVTDSNGHSILHMLSDYDVPDQIHGILGDTAAVAFILGHRSSYEFAFFTLQTLPSEFGDTIRDVFAPERYVGDGGDRLNQVIGTREQTVVMFRRGIQLVFVYYPIPPLYRPKLAPELGVSIFCLEDLASTKAYMISQGVGRWTEYIDLYMLITIADIPFSQVIQEMEVRFEGMVDDQTFINQLLDTRHIEDWDIPFKKGYEVSYDKVMTFFSYLVQCYLNRES